MRYARAGELTEQLNLEIEELMARTEASDGNEEEDPQAQAAAREARKEPANARTSEPLEERPQAREQDNLSDLDSRLMRLSKYHEYRQAYNAQATVDAEGSQLILGTVVSQSASDRRELVAGVTAIPAPLGRPTTVLADNGYVRRGGRQAG